MLQLKPHLVNFLSCDLHDGERASFWHDYWTDLGHLLSYIGEMGSRQFRISKDSRVVSAVRNGQWNLPAARSEEAQNLHIALMDIQPPTSRMGPDVFLWRKSNGTRAATFSSKDTWEQIRVSSPLISWTKVVWFKESVPRFSFNLWLAFLGRLPTRGRLRNWGLNIPSECVLCSAGIETHQHLFFQCNFSRAIWEPFAARIVSASPLDLSAISALLLQPRSLARVLATITMNLFL